MKALDSPLDQPKGQSSDGQDTGQLPKGIESALRLRRGLSDLPQDNGKTDECQRHIDHKDTAPTKGIHQQAADHRTSNQCYAGD